MNVEFGSGLFVMDVGEMLDLYVKVFIVNSVGFVVDG